MPHMAETAMTVTTFFKNYPRYAVFANSGLAKGEPAEKWPVKYYPMFRDV